MSSKEETTQVTLHPIQATRMRRQGQYSDSRINPMVSAHLQQMSNQRIQQNSAMTHFPGRPDTLPTDEHKYLPSKAEGQWHWDRDVVKGSDALPSHLYRDGKFTSLGHRPDAKMGLDKQGTRDPRAHADEHDMELGYEESSMPQTFESLEQKFLDETMKLIKEQQEAEDAENSRHRERIGEINAQYQEKLMGMRARQAALRDDFLRRECQVRHHQHQQQQASLSSYQNNAGPTDAHRGYGAAIVVGEGHRASTGDGYREGSRYLDGVRNHSFDSRGGPYPGPGGRSYDSSTRYY
ncbi:hypothetical protein ACLOJK_040854 [Asimina triloba]